jgi:hypothetical protein
MYERAKLVNWSVFDIMNDVDKVERLDLDYGEGRRTATACSGKIQLATGQL